ncbi:MAG: hypothetical protein SPL70_03420 [Cyanobacteriota bacterium]|nr:hypothetical protein [Cyanobacteriota bacterium]
MFSITRNVSISGYGMPMGPIIGGPMLPPMAGPCMPPIPMVGGYYGGICNNDMAAGYCVGAALSNPGVMHTLGTGIKWGWNHVIKPVGEFAWNKVLKPVGQFLWNDILKPVGNGLKWVWDHTLGRVFKKIGGSSSSEKAKDTPKTQDTTKTE